MDINQFLIQIGRTQKQIERLMNRTLPIKAGAEAKTHFQQNFIKGGFVNNGLKPWKKSLREREGKKSALSKYKTLLSSRTHLFRSIAYIPGNGMVKIINPVEYAAAHNEGATFVVKAREQVLHFNSKGRFNRDNKRAKYAQKVNIGSHQVTIPKRQFIGESHELNNKITNIIDTELRKLINP
jgi:phage gpG-like protein